MLQLDILRGVAILLVLNFHRLMSPAAAGHLSRPARALNQMGWSGVDLFFVLSGFLIGGLLFQELRARGRLDVRRFILRRGFKIWPSYLVYVAFLFGLYWLSEGGPWASAHELLPNFFHVQNYWQGPRGHTWSLAVEEHFYLALPLLLVLLTGRRGGRLASIPALPWVAAAVFVGCLAFRLALPVQGDFYARVRWTHYYPTHARMDSLFFGVLLAYFYQFRPDLTRRLARHRAALFVLGVALVAPLAYFPLTTTPWVSTVGYTMAYLGYGCILLVVVHTPLGEGWLGRLLASWPARAIAFIGIYSYPIYLWHIDAAQGPLQRLIGQDYLAPLPAEARWLVYMAAYVLLATAAGVLLGKLIERPALVLRDRLLPSQATPLRDAEAGQEPPKMAAVLSAATP